MTSSMEDFTKKLDGVELMVSQLMDKLSGLETWRSSADEATDRLLSQAETVISRLQRLEAAPPPPVPPCPSTAPPHPLPRRLDPFDLNLAPHQETRPPATSCSAGTVLPRITEMGSVGFSDPSRHTRSWVWSLVQYLLNSCIPISALELHPFPN